MGENANKMLTKSKVAGVFPRVVCVRRSGSGRR